MNKSRINLTYFLVSSNKLFLRQAINLASAMLRGTELTVSCHQII